MPIATINPGAMVLLERYAWPGNVRELEHVLGQALTRTHFGAVTAESLADCVHETAPTERLASEDAAYADSLLDKFPQASALSNF
jgi:transcriptional regulator with PAS, ATPase and Fis domain